MALALSGCLLVPEVPEEPITPIETPIVCEGGQYHVYWDEWSMTGCEGDEQVEGVYWKNADGRMFLLGDVVEFDPDGHTLDNIIKVYGDCPTSFVKEIEVK